jgi:S-DNA-T family DNA segregation ATPase FtsK/SpoIIIE
MTLPRLDLPRSEPADVDDEAIDMGIALERKFASLGVQCEVEDISVGPSTIRFELQPAAPKVKMRDFTRLSRVDDIAFELGVPSVVIQTPIPGKRAIGVEVTSPNRRKVLLGDVISAASAPLTAALGLTSDGPLGLALNRAPHSLLAGKSGSGKSSLLHSILASLVLTTPPERLRLVLGDTKMTELRMWENLPHLEGHVLTSIDRLLDGFDWCCEIMQDRYELITAACCQDIDQYNLLCPDNPMPHLLLVCDELADAMLAAKGALESYVVRIGQKGRACGISMLLATQSPRREVFSGLVKANAATRIALATVTALDSRIILDRAGAEQLLGAGDGLLDDGIGAGLQRFQSAYCPPETIREIVSAWNVEREEVAATT